MSKEKTIQITSIDDEIEITTIAQSKLDSQKSVEKSNKPEHIDLSTYNFTNERHIPKRYITIDGIFNTIVSDDELKNLAINTQNSINKIKRINSIAKYYINSDDIVGKIHETIENNVNPIIKLNFPSVDGRNKQKIKDKAEEILNTFHKSINVKKLLRKGISLAYDEGNYFMYLRGDKDNYKIDTYPLGIYEVSDLQIDDENLCVININELVSRLTSTGLTNTNTKIFNTKIDEQLNKFYPKEVYNAYLDKQIYAQLDITRTGHVTINDLNGRYGLTPIFKAFKPLKTAEIYDKTNISNAKTKSKKILVQVLSDKLLGQDGTNEFDTEKWEFANRNFVDSYKASDKSDLVLVTLPPWVKEIVYVEPKVDDINVETVNSARSKTLSALGINFLSNESKSSFNTVEINFDELIKTIDKISEGFAEVLDKFHSIVLLDNGIPLEYLPEVEIESSGMLSLELRMKLTDLIYSKMGLSYKSSIEAIGLNYEEELRRRLEENEFDTENGKGMDFVFTPHSSSFTANSNDLMNDTNGKNTNILNKDKEKQNTDKNKVKTQVK